MEKQKEFGDMTALELIEWVDSTRANEISNDVMDELTVAVIDKLRNILNIVAAIKFDLNEI